MRSTHARLSVLDNVGKEGSNTRLLHTHTVPVDLHVVGWWQNEGDDAPPHTSCPPRRSNGDALMTRERTLARQLSAWPMGGMPPPNLTPWFLALCDDDLTSKRLDAIRIVPTQ